jgi:hypothetical protein
MLLSMDPSPSSNKPGYLLDVRCRYRILIQGTLDAGWSDRLGEMDIAAAPLADGTAASSLIGELADQSALLGVLNTLHDLGLPLVSMERVDEEAKDRPGPLLPNRPTSWAR